MERARIFIDSKAISVLKAKDAPIFYVHGSGCDASIWKNQLEDIGGFAVDLPNHGESDKAEINSVEDYAFFVAKVIERTAGKGVIVGHSLGGAVAQMVYLKYKEVVKALALIGTGARLRVLPQILEGLAKKNIETLRLVSEMAFHRKEFVEAFTEFFSKNSEILLKDLSLCDKFDLLEDFKSGKIKFDVPTIAIVGENDLLTPVKYSKFFANFGAELAVVENSGHMVMLENPKKLNETLKGFLKKVL
ncbi:MAG: alpha/beta hydrolase [Archaeoglobaceae archaeon]